MEIMKDIDMKLNIDILLQQGICAHQAGYLFGLFTLILYKFSMLSFSQDQAH